MSALWQKSLERLQHRFSALSGGGNKLASLLTETLVPLPPDSPAPKYSPHSLNNLPFVAAKTGGLYREMEQLYDDQGRSVPTDESLPPAPGRGLVSYNGVKYDFAPGATRTAKYYSNSNVLHDWAPLASEAALVVRDVPELAKAFPWETLRLSALANDELRWLYVLYNLAWREVPGSPLRAERFVREVIGDSSFTIRIDHLRAGARQETWAVGPGPIDDFGKWVAAIPDPPPHVYSILEDVIGASVAAMDILLSPSLPGAPDDLSPDTNGSSVALPELARQLSSLAADVEGKSSVTNSIKRNAVQLSEAIRQRFYSTAMRGREVEPGRFLWVRRNDDRPIEVRRLEHHLWQALAVLSDLQDGRNPPDAPLKLRAIAKDIEETARTGPDNSDGEAKVVATTPAEPTRSHSSDFTFVNWYGTEYTFALGVQSSAVKELWGEWEKSGLGLHQDTIRNAIDAERDSFRMDTAFRDHPAFGTMIQRCGDGKYKLAHPTADPSAPKSKAKKSAGITPKSRQKRL